MTWTSHLKWLAFNFDNLDVSFNMENLDSKCIENDDPMSDMANRTVPDYRNSCTIYRKADSVVDWMACSLDDQLHWNCIIRFHN